jgi:hypothetical protein
MTKYLSVWSIKHPQYFKENVIFYNLCHPSALYNRNSNHISLFTFNNKAYCTQHLPYILSQIPIRGIFVLFAKIRNMCWNFLLQSLNFFSCLYKTVAENINFPCYLMYGSAETEDDKLTIFG